jgi:hypothetical protein
MQSSKAAAMPRYHDNKLATVGLDSDDDEKPHIPSMPIKRKRDYNSAITAHQDHTSQFNVVNGVNSINEYDRSFDPWSMTSSVDTYNSPLDEFFLDDYINQNGTVSNAPLPQDTLYGSNDYVQPMPNMVAEASQVVGYADVEDNGTLVKSEDDGLLVKFEDQSDLAGSVYSSGGSDYAESDPDERRKPKAPKLNKDGCPRKPREPRPKLLKWDDNDWKNVALALVWACGENDIQIPFDQASQIVSESCTAGALQQALLKLRCKQIADGQQIPPLRMAWTRKNKNTASSVSSVDTKIPQNPNGTPKRMPPRRKPTRFASNQSLLITLKRAYKDADRCHLVVPYTMTTSAASAMHPTTTSTQVGPDASNSKARSTGLLATPPHTPGTQQGWNTAGHYNTPQLAPIPVSPFVYVSQTIGGPGLSNHPDKPSQECANFKDRCDRRATVTEYGSSSIFPSPNSDSFECGTGNSSPVDTAPLNFHSSTRANFNLPFEQQVHNMARVPSLAYAQGLQATGQVRQTIPQPMHKLNDRLAMSFMDIDGSSMDMKFMHEDAEGYLVGDPFFPSSSSATSSSFGGLGGEGGFAA